MASIATSASPMRQRQRLSWAWLGVVPFFLFAIAFLITPAAWIVVQSFRDARGAPTLANVQGLFTPFILSAYIYSISLSLVTAIGGGIMGFLMAYAICVGGLPRWLRDATLSFSGVASNFAGIPLAFAFIATIGQLGLVTRWLKTIGISLYPTFSLYGFWGLALVYLYFQIPLMVLLMAPALEGLRRDWREACESLGGDGGHYWRAVALPILLPSILGTMVLLFGNAFGAYATAFQLTGGASQGNLVTILIGAQVSSDALANPGFGNALALGMIVIMALTIAIYQPLQRQSERWLRRE